jgi:hypothetical protein
MQLTTVNKETNKYLYFEMSFVIVINFLLQRLTEQIHERNEHMKTEMLGKF